MAKDKEKYGNSLELEKKIQLNRSRLNNLLSMPLTEGYHVANTPEYQDSLTFFEEEIESAEDELGFLHEDKFLEEYFKIRDTKQS